jgi:hypothetical protein
MHREELSFMDRVTVFDGESITSEVLHLKNINVDNVSKLFSYLSYQPKEILYIALFINDSTPLKRLVQDEDYTIEDNKIYLDEQYFSLKQYSEDYSYNKDLPSLTIRYKHNPVFHIIEMKRETMQSYRSDYGKERLIHLPISCLARRAHYVLNSGMYTSKDILNNSFNEDPCKLISINGINIKIPCFQNQNLITFGQVVWVSSENRFYFKDTDSLYKQINLDALISMQSDTITQIDANQDWNNV